MKIKRILVHGLIACALLLSGCRHIYSGRQVLLTDNWGRSFQAVRFIQVMDPDAGTDLAPASEMNGLAYQTAMETYRQKFQKQETNPLVTIELGGNRSCQ